MAEISITTGSVTLFGIFGTLVVIFLNHLLAKTRDAKNKRADQGRKVVEAFSEELDEFISSDKDAMYILTDDAFNRHKTAVRNFMPFLSWLNKLRFQWRWARFALIKTGKTKHPCYDQYADCGSLDKRQKIRPIVIKRIQDIISFANK